MLRVHVYCGTVFSTLFAARQHGIAEDTPARNLERQFKEDLDFRNMKDGNTEEGFGLLGGGRVSF